MSCYRPLSGYRSAGGVTLSWRENSRWMELPCGRCIGCRMDRARSWKLRIMHEASMHDESYCMTLTYSEKWLPESRSLVYEDFQSFLKSLRELQARKYDRTGVRFFVAGEYGEQFERPHWHAILFNLALPDLKGQSLYGKYYFSSEVERLWKRGGVVIDRLSGAAAAYVAGYTFKKAREAVYRESVVDLKTGELSDRRPPFVVMSRRPGIGASWYQKWCGDVLPRDYVVAEGQKYKVPRYYTDQFRKVADPGSVEEVMHGRYLPAEERRSESTPERRAVREKLAEERVSMFEASSRWL